jgi:hypothetical protein
MGHPAHFARSEDPSFCRRPRTAPQPVEQSHSRDKRRPCGEYGLYGPTPKVELCLVLRVDANDARLAEVARACVLSGRPTVAVLIFGEPLARFRDSVAGWGCVPAVPDLNRKGRAAPRSGERAIFWAQP